MAKLDKLIRRFLDGQKLTFAEFRAVLEAYGWRLDRVRGSHHLYRHKGASRPLPIEPDGKDARLSAQASSCYDRAARIGSRSVNSTYHINLFWSDEEQAWVADVPDLEPCTTFGATRAEAIAKAEDLIDLWLDSARASGDPIPEPRYRPAIYAFRAA